MGIFDRISAGQKSMLRNLQKREDYYRIISNGNGDIPVEKIPEASYRVFIDEEFHSVWPTRDAARQVKKLIKKTYGIKAFILRADFDTNGMIVREEEVR